MHIQWHKQILIITTKAGASVSVVTSYLRMVFFPHARINYQKQRP